MRTVREPFRLHALTLELLGGVEPPSPGLGGLGPIQSARANLWSPRKESNLLFYDSKSRTRYTTGGGILAVGPGIEPDTLSGTMGLAIPPKHQLSCTDQWRMAEESNPWPVGPRRISSPLVPMDGAILLHFWCSWKESNLLSSPTKGMCFHYHYKSCCGDRSPHNCSLLCSGVDPGSGLDRRYLRLARV